MPILSRIRSPLRMTDLSAAVFLRRDASHAQFERRFAERFGFDHAVLFPSARTAIRTLLEALSLREADVLCPAYTCVAVPAAIAASGNRVRFIDSSRDHFLPDENAIRQALAAPAAAAVLTPLYGYARGSPAALLRELHPGIFIVGDEAQSFRDVPIERGMLDAAVYSFGLGKAMTALSGGMLVLRNADLALTVRAYRDAGFTRPPLSRDMRLIARGALSIAAYREPLVRIVHTLEGRGANLRSAGYDVSLDAPGAQAYERPPLPSPMQIALGMRQLARLDEMMKRRAELGDYYQTRLTAEGFSLFAWDERPSWVRFPFAAAGRAAVVAGLHRAGIQVGTFLDYACTELPGFAHERDRYPRASDWARMMINLPNWPGMRRNDAGRVVNALVAIRGEPK
jgi:perosamine synthetase